MLFQSNHKGHFQQWEKDTFTYITHSTLSCEQYPKLHKGFLIQCDRRGLQNFYLSRWSWMYSPHHNLKSSRQVCVTYSKRCECPELLFTIDNYFSPMVLCIIPHFEGGGETGDLCWCKCVWKVHLYILMIVNYVVGLGLGYFLAAYPCWQKATPDRWEDEHHWNMPPTSVSLQRDSSELKRDRLPTKPGTLDSGCTPSFPHSASFLISISYQSPGPMLNFWFGKELYWLPALETFLHEHFLYDFGRHI